MKLCAMDKSLTFRSHRKGRTIPCRGKTPPRRYSGSLLLVFDLKEMQNLTGQDNAVLIALLRSNVLVGAGRM